jgi:hypothetical protein
LRDIVFAKPVANGRQPSASRPRSPRQCGRICSSSAVRATWWWSKTSCARQRETSGRGVGCVGASNCNGLTSFFLAVSQPFTTLYTRRSPGPRPQPRSSQCAVVRDEIAAVHSITSSARPSSASGTVRPSAFAVLRLTTSSNFVGCCTGRSAGFSPLRMRAVNRPTCR